MRLQSQLLTPVFKRTTLKEAMFLYKRRRWTHCKCSPFGTKFVDEKGNRPQLGFSIFNQDQNLSFDFQVCETIRLWKSTQQMSLSSKQWLPSGSADLSTLSGGLCIPSFQSALVPGDKDLESTFEHRTIGRVFQDNRFNDQLIILEHCLLYPIHHDKPC